MAWNRAWNGSLGRRGFSDFRFCLNEEMRVRKLEMFLSEHKKDARKMKENYLFCLLDKAPD